ncbi:hypothetical protein BT63DRAFT_453499 [Microthyrium microscopicum]|uniref:Secreted protein n=1 Tax=Microthyrium microscopicum TaxID=703497 RepID=A0A6A6UFR1_9PEZI|nr:hypothetical protein BT63DRAFT_453499 [Microthyrium microscopicum]
MANLVSCALLPTCCLLDSSSPLSALVSALRSVLNYTPVRNTFSNPDRGQCMIVPLPDPSYHQANLSHGPAAHGALQDLFEVLVAGSSNNQLTNLHEPLV